MSFIYFFPEKDLDNHFHNSLVFNNNLINNINIHNNLISLKLVFLFFIEGISVIFSKPNKLFIISSLENISVGYSFLAIKFIIF